jgi:hypothetical protein
MKKVFFLLILVVITSQTVNAQRVFTFGPELGIGITRFPKHDKITSSYDNATEKYHPYYGPLVGLHAQLILKKLILLMTGLQYQICGTRFIFHNDGLDPNHASAPFTADIKEKITFHKVCLPLSVGLSFRLFHLRWAVYGEDRLNYFIKGNYSKNTVVEYSTMPTLNYDITEEYDPLDESVKENLKPFNNQVFFGVSASKGRFEVAVNHYIGQKLSFSANPLTGYADFKNNDYTVTLRYRCYLRKKSKECNLYD